MKLVNFSVLFAFIANLSFAQPIPTDSMYLGKTVPGNSPIVFLSGVTERICVSSDGKDIFYNTSSGLSYYHYTIAGWNAPFALFIGFGEASLSLNDSILYVQNSQMDSYYSLKNDTGWNQSPIKLWNTNSAGKHQLQVTNSGTFYANTNHIVSSRGDISKIITDGSDISFESLPFPVNSSLNGVDFYMAKDESYVIFPEIIGGSADLYISYKKTDTTWTNPKSLGSKINNTDWEYGPFISPDNSYLFFSRSSANATYWVKLGNIIDSLKNTNFAPYVKNKVANQTDTLGRSYNFTIPDTIFIDDDGNNTLSYSATLSNGNPLPSWLPFNPETNTLSGTLDSVGIFTIKINVTDTTEASISTTFVLEVVESLTSIRKIMEQNIQIFPNPTKDKLTISFGSISYKNAVVELIDLNGRSILSNNYHNTSNITIDLTNYLKGIYILKLVIDGEKISKKVCIEK